MEQKSVVLVAEKKIAYTARPSMAIMRSVTREEIERFWRRKRVEEEEHLLAAQKAAARIRARALTEEHYKRFEESVLKDIIMMSSSDGEGVEVGGGGNDEEEVRVGIKDWWTKSRYAYLNQPAIKSMEKGATPKLTTTTYIPQEINFFCSSSVPILPITRFSLGVF